MKQGIVKVTKKLFGGGTAVVLSLAMALGIFAGMRVEAKAEEAYEIVEIDEPASFEAMKGMCEFDLSDGKMKERQEYILTQINSLKASSAGELCVIHEMNGGNIQTYMEKAWSDITSEDDYLRRYKGKNYKWYLLKGASTSGSNTSNSEASASTGAPRKSDSDTPVYVHTHSYSWVTVQEAGTEQDGIEEYRCSCGDVQERNIIPASEVLVKGLFGEIKDAPLNGSTAFDTGRQYTLSDYIIRKLAERTDVTTVITFEYEGQSYRMTIPAGADYSQLLADEDYFYGYFYFANAVGAVIEAL